MTDSAAATPTRVAIVTFDGFNELDSFIALGLQPLEYANEADVVLFGSGIHTRALAESAALVGRFALDPTRQLIGAQCSGTLLLARLGLLGDMPACTDLATKPWAEQAGVHVVNAPFYARGPVATAGGCLASQYLATWVMLKRAGLHATEQALRYAAPVGEKDEYVARLVGVVRPLLAE